MTIFGPSLIQGTTKIKYVCVIVFLSVPLAMGEVPGPCRHSITRDHLLTVRHLIDNQLMSGCSMTYRFIEQRGLSKCCFVKAAIPWILELLTTHFRYARGSINDSYVQSLRALILNIYSQKCVPQINEELEDDPVSFEKTFFGPPSEALEKAQEVLTVYWELITTRDTSLDWICQREYNDALDITTEPPSENHINLSTEDYITGSADMELSIAFQSSLERDMYKLGFITASICGGLLLMITVYCLIKQRIFFPFLESIQVGVVHYIINDIYRKQMSKEINGISSLTIYFPVSYKRSSLIMLTSLCFLALIILALIIMALIILALIILTVSILTVCIFIFLSSYASVVLWQPLIITVFTILITGVGGNFLGHSR
ncbi:uncharacterized protein FYW47_002621 [Aplochiton taeniatus]